MSKAASLPPERKKFSWGRLRKRLGDLLWYLVVTFLALAVMVPFIWMVVTSLKGQNEVFAYPPSWVPQDPQWNNYVDVWQAAPFGRYFTNSTIVALLVTIGQLTSCI